MKIRVTKSFNRRGEAQEIGSVFEIPDEALLSLEGYVEPVVFFEQTGDPVSCKFWKQVCWFADIYWSSCTRDSGCSVYKFLEVNS